MSTTAQAQRPAAAARDESPLRTEAAIAPVPFLQRSGIGPAAFAEGVNAVIADTGQSLAPEVRADMEDRFGADFGGVRVHDDARAHDSARSADAAAYAVGEHVVFGSGRYQPATDTGRALLAHELAHTVQQGGVQFMRLDGHALADHAGLEHEADRAADAALAGQAPPPLTRVNAPTLARAPDTFAKEKGGNALKTLGLQNLSFVEAASEDTIDGQPAISVLVKSPLKVLPKGRNTWVSALWKQYGDKGQLVFKGMVSSGRLPAVKETVPFDEYKAAWLSAYGFSSLQDLGTALGELLDANPSAVSKDKKVQAEAAVAAKNFSGGVLGGSKVANIDHIVEKQVGGTSIPQNMQILNAEENQASGRQLNQDIVAQADEVLTAATGRSYKMIRLRYATVQLQPSKEADAYDEIEALLRARTLKPTKKGKEGPEGTPVTLAAGGAQVTVYVGKAAKGTPIADHPHNDPARRLISGLDLQVYRPGSGKKSPDQVEAVIDSERLKGAIQKAGGKGAKSEVLLDASPSAEGTGQRTLAISGKTKALDFVFPYLSPGRFTKLQIAPDNSLEAEGYITPTLKFLKRIDVRLARDTLELRGNLGPENFQPPFRGFKFTETALVLQLAPEFRPSGRLAFQVGPEAKPYAVGDVKAGLDGTNVVLDGTLAAKNLPGIDAATGKVRFHQAEGWSGEMKATTSKLPRTKKSEVLFGFRTEGGATKYHASGLIQFDVGTGKDLSITAAWRNDKLVYGGSLAWEKPIKLVDEVVLRFTYEDDKLSGHGETGISYKKFKGRIKVFYEKKGEEDAKLWGSGAVDVKTDKAEGQLGLEVSPKGVISGKGSVSYQFSDKLKPTVGVILHPDGHLTLVGRIEVTKPIELFPRFPKQGGERDLIKVNIDFIIPGPFPGLADPMVHLGAGVRFTYGIGPGQIVNTVIEGSFDPLEENKNAKLKFTSTLELPAHVGLTGILEAGLGIAVLGGLAAKVHGGLRLEPGFRLQMMTRAPVTAEYDQGDFSFEGRVEMQGGLVLGLAIKLYAHVEAIGGAVEKDFSHELKNYQYDVGQSMTLTLAKIAYSTKTGFKAPSLDDIKIQPNNIDPVAMIRKVGESAKAALAGQG